MIPALAIAKNPSGNAKLGDAATTHAAQASCPDSCVFKDGGGCYAETGRQGMFITRRLNEAAAGASALEVALAEADAIDDLDVVPGRPMRLHTVGDCPTDETARVVSLAAERYVDRGGGPVWTYTHAWRDVARESWGRVSVLASCETAADVAEAKARGYATSMVVAEFPRSSRYTVDGISVVPCPAMTRDVACSDCRLCFRDDRRAETDVTIGFEIHGIPYAKRQARIALERPDDPLRRVSSEERIRIVREEFLLREDREPTTREVAEIVDLNVASVAEWLRYHRGESDHPAAERRRRDARRKVPA